MHTTMKALGRLASPLRTSNAWLTVAGVVVAVALISASVTGLDRYVLDHVFPRPADPASGGVVRLPQGEPGAQAAAGPGAPGSGASERTRVALGRGTAAGRTGRPGSRGGERRSGSRRRSGDDGGPSATPRRRAPLPAPRPVAPATAPAPAAPAPAPAATASPPASDRPGGGSGGSGERRDDDGDKGGVRKGRERERPSRDRVSTIRQGHADGGSKIREADVERTIPTRGRASRGRGADGQANRRDRDGGMAAATKDAPVADAGGTQRNDAAPPPAPAPAHGPGRVPPGHAKHRR